MSVGFIMFEIVDKDSLKNQGINTAQYLDKYCEGVGYSLKNQGINTTTSFFLGSKRVGYSLKYQGINTKNVASSMHSQLDIHLNIKVLTP